MRIEPDERRNAEATTHLTEPDTANIRVPSLPRDSIQPPTRVHMQVVSAHDRSSLANATLTITPLPKNERGGPSITRPSALNPNWLLEAPPGYPSVTVTAECVGYQSTRFTIDCTRSLPLVTMAIAALESWQIKLVTSDGSPLAWAQVEVSAPGGMSSDKTIVTTDASGYGYAMVPRGPQAVRLAEPAGWTVLAIDPSGEGGLPVAPRDARSGFTT